MTDREGPATRRARLRKAIGDRIKEAMELRGWSTGDLAKRFGELDPIGAKNSWTDPRVVWALGEGQRAIDLEDFIVLSEAFGIPMWFFVSPLLPNPSEVTHDEAERRALAGYSQFLMREAKRKQREVAKTLNDPEFLQMISDLAGLPTGRRRQVRDTIEALHALEEKRRKKQ
jgi:transcriptional regulator with XRE-family HTH domain